MSSGSTPPSEDGRLLIGRRETIALPDWGVERIRAKIDTGAKTSAIDVAHLEELRGGRVRFDVVADRAHPERYTTVEAEVIRRGLVRTSLGQEDARLVVRTTVRIGPVEREIELGLVCRRRMKCRVLLGRSALAGAFLVDPGRADLLSASRKRRKKRKPAPSAESSDPHHRRGDQST